MRRVVIALLLFGISFGYVEAAVVVYLRALYQPLRKTGDLFPLITVQQLDAAGPANVQRLLTEIGREGATLLMLAAVALAIGRNAQEWAAAFAVAFGLWDIFFYVFLRVLSGWPLSLGTWDLLFLIPVPWAAPVVAPVVVSITMICAGLITLHRPMRLHRLHWGMVFLGALIIILSFTWDYRNTSAGGMPNPFHWGIFATGELIGLAGFCMALLNIPVERRQP